MRPWARPAWVCPAGTSFQKCPELAAQAGLVAFDGEQVVRAAAMQVSGVLALGVHRISGNHGTGQVGDLVQDHREHGDLVGLAVQGDLCANHAGVVVEAGHQVWGAPVTCPGAAHGLAVYS